MTDTGCCYGKFVWHDLVTGDIEPARDFYAALFPEWSFREIDMDGGMIYHLISVGGRDVGGIIPMNSTGDGRSYWIGHVSVADCDATVVKMESLGGKMVMPVFNAERVGRFATVADPQGAALNPFQLEYDIPLDDKPFEGRFCWDELLTSDIGAAARFYNEVFGWDVEQKDFGDTENYTLFKLGDEQVAGGMALPPGVESPRWMTYLATLELEPRLEKAAQLGGKQCTEIIEIPEIGRMAVISDTAGAGFSLFEPRAAP